ncbi:MAG: hypothetical protein GWN76_00270, partial [candidate division Zixibacteria bacterium]|nr:hypothetical protein [candidate division Zixibacteria bacterium]
AFVDIGTDIYDGFIAEVQKIGEDIGGWFSDIGSKITTAKDAVVDKAVEVGSGVYDAISGKFTEIVN